MKTILNAFSQKSRFSQILYKAYFQYPLHSKYVKRNRFCETAKVETPLKKINGSQKQKICLIFFKNSGHDHCTLCAHEQFISKISELINYKFGGLFYIWKHLLIKIFVYYRCLVFFLTRKTRYFFTKIVLLTSISCPFVQTLLCKNF